MPLPKSASAVTVKATPLPTEGVSPPHATTRLAPGASPATGQRPIVVAPVHTRTSNEPAATRPRFSTVALQAITALLATGSGAQVSALTTRSGAASPTWTAALALLLLSLSSSTAPPLSTRTPSCQPARTRLCGTTASHVTLALAPAASAPSVQVPTGPSLASMMVSADSTIWLVNVAADGHCPAFSTVRLQVASAPARTGLGLQVNAVTRRSGRTTVTGSNAVLLPSRLSATAPLGLPLT